MSHELRTPLNAIIGFTGTLLMELPGAINDEQRSQLETVQTSAKHLLSIINDLLDLAKIESGKVEIKLGPLDCRAVVEEVATALRPLAEGKGLAFEVSVPKRAVTVTTDKRALSQILINLTNNAIKFTDSGAVRITIGQITDNGRPAKAITVQDTGVGIGREDQSKLFEAFERSSESVSRGSEGTGLGLHISQKLSALIGARIIFESEPGVGSKFAVVFPEL